MIIRNITCVNALCFFILIYVKTMIQQNCEKVNTVNKFTNTKTTKPMIQYGQKYIKSIGVILLLMLLRLVYKFEKPGICKNQRKCHKGMTYIEYGSLGMPSIPRPAIHTCANSIPWDHGVLFCVLCVNEDGLNLLFFSMKGPICVCDKMRLTIK